MVPVSYLQTGHNSQSPVGSDKRPSRHDTSRRRRLSISIMLYETFLRHIHRQGCIAEQQLYCSHFIGLVLEHGEVSSTLPEVVPRISFEVLYTLFFFVKSALQSIRSRGYSGSVQPVIHLQAGLKWSMMGMEQNTEQRMLCLGEFT